MFTVQFHVERISQNTFITGHTLIPASEVILSDLPEQTYKYNNSRTLWVHRLWENWPFINCRSLWSAQAVLSCRVHRTRRKPAHVQLNLFMQHQKFSLHIKSYTGTQILTIHTDNIYVYSFPLGMAISGTCHTCIMHNKTAQQRCA